ncbi:MAG: hypothetical protein COS40_08105 [Deltaproteobacteria bacterium CG03_land_8_20_14_0_80_45_14]|nr:MAG: hypothetical protein COS40_08105 [Deltaproteobacteria bacterium CG03_land_8_20_14_0_80_45_14]
MRFEAKPFASNLKGVSPILESCPAGRSSNLYRSISVERKAGKGDNRLSLWRNGLAILEKSTLFGFEDL